MPIPYVTEGSGSTERNHDVFGRLLKDRIVFLGEPIEYNIANGIVACLLFLESDKSGEPINMYINSPGGVVTDGLAIIDTMRYIKSPVNTICIGQAASMGAVLLASGTGRRLALPNSRIMLHQPLGGAMGQATDMEIQVGEIKRLKGILNSIVAERTGQPIEKVRADLERDFFMSAAEAKEYGIIDDVVNRG